MNKKELLSNLFLGISLIIFSVGVPLIQERIDYWKQQRETYFKNLLNAEFQKVIGIWAVNLYETMDIIKESPLAAEPEVIKLIDKIKKLYLEKAMKASVNMYFLQTELVNNDEKPDKKRYEEIKNKFEECSPLIYKEADSFLGNFNRDYQNGLKYWGNWKVIAYIIAIIFYFWGVWLGLKTKKDPNENLVKELRNLIPRINILIKKFNKNT
jgi:hypothetical protein